MMLNINYNSFGMFIMFYRQNQQNKVYQQKNLSKMLTQIDYRNAKYQGQINKLQQRNGPGILIDDDLSLYSSIWQQGKLNNSTVIYISHGKYIYGLWENNQPNGLNVFRIGDTVLLGEFSFGRLVRKAIVIFQKFNFVAILQENLENWDVVKRGILKSYSELVSYIQEAGIPMKPQYFSLTKFLTYISNNRAAAVPCQGSQNCYYGFEQGLGIVFNPNNGVVSVGHHQNKKLTQFGGKFQQPNIVFEGNFQTSQVIRYTRQRPKQQIYSIYQKLHKRSLNFKNEYFDSKIKLLTNVEELIRSKIQQIIHMNDQEQHKQNTITALDLNDSLDYHVQNMEEMNRIREEVYENARITMRKTTSQYVEASPKSNKKAFMTPTKKKAEPITNAPSSPIPMKKSPLKKQKERDNQKQRQKQKQREREKQRQRQRQKQKQRERERERQREKQKSRRRQKIQQKQKELSRTPSKRGIPKVQVNQYKEHTFANIQQATEKQATQPVRQLTRTPTKKTFGNIQNSCQLVAYEQRIAQRQQYLLNQAQKLNASSSSVKRPLCQIQNKSPYSAKYLVQYPYSNSSNSQLKNISSPLNSGINVPGSFSYAKSSQYIRKQDNRTQEEPMSPIDQILVSSKNYVREKQIYNVPSFKYSCSQFDKTQNITAKSRVSVQGKLMVSQRAQKVQKIQRTQRIQNVEWIDSSISRSSRNSVSPVNITKKATQTRYTQISKSPIKTPTYQNLSQRRKRLLKQFKNLNQQQQSPIISAFSKIPPPPPPFVKTTSLQTGSQQLQTKYSKQVKQTLCSKISPPLMIEIESPCARQKFPSYQSKNTEQQSQTMMPLTICKSSNDLHNDWKRKSEDIVEKMGKIDKYDRQLKGTNLKSAGKQLKNPGYERIIDRSSKQNQDMEPKSASRPFQKKQSYYEKMTQIGVQKLDTDISSLTPNKRKQYKYFFDE